MNTWKYLNLKKKIFISNITATLVFASWIETAGLGNKLRHELKWRN